MIASQIVLGLSCSVAFNNLLSLVLFVLRRWARYALQTVGERDGTGDM